jgi:N-acetylmuramoyl-L-alanine amidase
MKRSGFVLWAVVFSLMWLAGAFGSPVFGTPLQEFTFGKSDRMRVGFDGTTILVQIRPRSGDGVFRFAAWTLKDWRNNYKKVPQLNRDRPLHRDQFVTIPFRYLLDSLQGIALQAVFDKDSSEENGWGHRVVYPGETMSLISGLYAIDDITPQALLRYNDLPEKGHILSMGQVIIIPWEWVRPGLNLFPYEVRPPLTLQQDGSGKRYAAYRIQRGESLYSAVVVRFTGRTLPEDVNELAGKLMILNRITDPHRIFVGTELLIPLEWISEEYLVQHAPESTEETEQAVKAEQLRVTDWSNIHIIIDPGHGGSDPGATAGSAKAGDLVYESALVHDIGLRLGRLLEAKRYNVHYTLKSPQRLEPAGRLIAIKHDDDVILVNPPYRIKSPRTAVNMRVFLINDLYERLRRRQIPPQNIILISVHGDILHQSLSGAMVYYADPRLREYAFKLQHGLYRQRQEYRPQLIFPNRDNHLAAKLSATFGKAIIGTFAEQGLKVQTNVPLRGYYYRKGIKTLPAVLRYSPIPTSVLIEVANLNNVHDRRSVLDERYRQRLAEGLALSIANHLKNQS